MALGGENLMGKRSAVVISGLGAIVLLLLLIGQPAPAQQGGSIVWSAPTISEVVTPGASTSVQVSITSATNLQNIILEAVPAISPFVTLQPNNFSTVNAGQPQNVKIVFSAPLGAQAASYSGTVHVLAGARTLPQTLKVSVVVSQVPITVSFPGNYQPNSQVLSQGGPILLNNFGSQYLQGGLVPPGGAEISITTIPLPRPPLMSLISNELQGATITSTSTITVAGSSCTEVFFTDSFGQNYNYSEVAAYCPHNSTLYKLFLFYTAGDPAAAQFLSAFQQVLNSIQFIK